MDKKKKRILENPDKLVICSKCNQYVKQFCIVVDRQTCRDCIKKYHREWEKTNSEQLNKKKRDFYQTKGIQSKSEYYQKNKRKILDRENKRYKTDPSFKVRRILRLAVLRGIKQAVKNGKEAKKTSNTQNLLGCTFMEFKSFIETKWIDGMSWDNHGYGKDKWNLDHILPIASFDCSKQAEQEKCFHYTNYQPLWQTDNMKKGDKIINKPE
jgi:hypothetical protein